MYSERLLTRLIVAMAMIALLTPNVLGTTTLTNYEGGSDLLVCPLTGCGGGTKYGVSASIQVNNETINAANSGETIAQWISVDFYYGIFGSNHDWVQTGWAIGYLPNGVFTSTPVLYAEHTINGVYGFSVLKSVSFGTYLFQVYDSCQACAVPVWQIFAGGSSQSVVACSSCGSSSEQYGQVSAGLEIHEPGTVSTPNLSANGHWSNLQFYDWSACPSNSLIWVYWGSSDPSLCGPNTTQGGFWGSCFIDLRSISNSEFKAQVAANGCAGGGGGGHQMGSSPAYIGPGPQGGSPVGSAVPPPSAVLVLGIYGVFLIFVFFWGRILRMLKSTFRKL